MIKFAEVKDEDLKSIIATLEVTKVVGGFDKLVVEVFKEFDTDKNGVLDRKEMRTFFGKIFTEWKVMIPMSDEFLDDLFRDIDKDHSNSISPGELKLYLTKYVHFLLPAFQAELAKRQDKVKAEKK